MALYWLPMSRKPRRFLCNTAKTKREFAAATKLGFLSYCLAREDEYDGKWACSILTNNESIQSTELSQTSGFRCFQVPLLPLLSVTFASCLAFFQIKYRRSQQRHPVTRVCCQLLGLCWRSERFWLILVLQTKTIPHGDVNGNLIQITGTSLHC
jgi:hypothetical protein